MLLSKHRKRKTKHTYPIQKMALMEIWKKRYKKQFQEKYALLKNAFQFLTSLFVYFCFHCFIDVSVTLNSLLFSIFVFFDVLHMFVSLLLWLLFSCCHWLFLFDLAGVMLLVVLVEYGRHKSLSSLIAHCLKRLRLENPNMITKWSNHELTLMKSTNHTDIVCVEIKSL